MQRIKRTHRRLYRLDQTGKTTYSFIVAYIKIGTCSWKYPSWKGLVYSQEKESGYLSEYAEKYTTVEIDQWFWSLFGEDKVVLPRREVAMEYSQAVPEDFLFTVKVPNSITLTHLYKKGKAGSLVKNQHFLSDRLFAEFLERIEPVKGKLGILMFQFEYLNKQKMSSVKEFMDRLETFIAMLPKDYTYGVEVRNPGYLNKDYFSFLKNANLTPVFLQGYYMPDIFPLYSNVKELVRDYVVIRLHGPNRQDMEKLTGGVWDKIIAEKDEEIKLLAGMLEDLQKRQVNVFVNVNNHYEGSAPLTINKVLARCNAKGLHY